MAAVIAYILFTIQLVCHLVSSETSNADDTDSAAIKMVLRNQVTSLPEGYIDYPDIGFAYKYHANELTWVQARNACWKEGAQLAVIDSLKKMEYLAPRLEEDLTCALAGIVRMDATWVNINTGDPVAKTVVWQPGAPSENLDCAQFAPNFPYGLTNFKCNETYQFFCEIPIFTVSVIPVN